MFLNICSKKEKPHLQLLYQYLNGVIYNFKPKWLLKISHDAEKVKLAYKFSHTIDYIQNKNGCLCGVAVLSSQQEGGWNWKTEP